MPENPSFRIDLYVKPGARSDAVGGTFDGALIVRVTAPPDRGRANKAVCEQVAEAFGVRRSAVTLIRGGQSRRKTVEVDPDGVGRLGGAGAFERRLSELRMMP